MAKILIVEDNDQLAGMLAERLGRRRHVVLLAVDAASAFSSAKAANPDIVLLEAQLRGGTDWAAARALKSDDHTREIPILALLSDASEEAQAAARQAGAEDAHVKPIDFAKLLQQIGALARASAPETAPE